MNDTRRVSGRSFVSVPTTDEDTTEAFEMARIADDSHSSSAELIGMTGHAEDQSQANWRGSHSTTESHHSSVKEPVRMSSRFRITAKQWLAEISSFIVGAGALVCIIVLLVRYNHRELPQWPSGINLSAVVAALATLLRSMLMQAVEPSAYISFPVLSR